MEFALEFRQQPLFMRLTCRIFAEIKSFNKLAGDMRLECGRCSLK